MRRYASTLALVAGIVLLGVLVYRIGTPSVSSPEQVRGNDRERPVAEAIRDFDPGEIETVLPRDAIAAVFEPRLAPADEAGLEDEELVIGIEIAGEAHAYPVRVLSAHEIVNDEIAGQPFAVTW